ncbi:MAG TPA: DUF2059 domain-containing protein [Terriglobales bacterium]|nr:DUF2059 domain-containing protein [Terriglobales bacterium]
MKQLLSYCVLVLVCSMGVFAQTSSPAASNAQTASAQSRDQSAKRAEIRKLIELTGAANVSADALRKIIDPLRAGFPQVPDDFWNTFIKEVHSDELIDLVVPIYDKYYTRDEIQDLTRFYQSPVGQKTIKVLPMLSSEAIDAGQEWGKMVADRAMRKLREEGYDKKSSLGHTDLPVGQ